MQGGREIVVDIAASADYDAVVICSDVSCAVGEHHDCHFQPPRSKNVGLGSAIDLSIRGHCGTFSPADGRERCFEFA